MFFRVYAYTSGGGDGGAGAGEAAPKEQDFKARLAMFKQRESGSFRGGST